MRKARRYAYYGREITIREAAKLAFYSYCGMRDRIVRYGGDMERCIDDAFAKGCNKYLYTVRRTKDDAIIVFEETAERAAEIMGIRVQTIYEQLSRQRKYGIRKRSRYIIEVIRIGAEDEEWEEDECL